MLTGRQAGRQGSHALKVYKVASRSLDDFDVLLNKRLVALQLQPSPSQPAPMNINSDHPFLPYLEHPPKLAAVFHRHLHMPYLMSHLHVPIVSQPV